MLVSAFCFIQQMAFASDFTEQITQLDIDVQMYQCPQYDEVLANELVQLTKNNELIQSVCEFSGHEEECLNGAFSLFSEATGLANIALDPNTGKYGCYMARSDQQMLHLYFELFLENNL